MPDRMAPQNLEAEKAVLGAVLMQGSLYSVAAEILSPDDFLQEANRKIFRAMSRINTPGAIDTLTIFDALSSENKDREISKSYISNLLDGLPQYGEKQVASYAGIVKDLSLRRQAISQGTRLINEAYAGQEPAVDLIIKNARRIEVIADGGIQEEIEEPSMIWQKKHELATSGDPYKNRVRTGMPFDLCAGEGGAAPGELIIIAAPTGCGKTAAMLNMAIYAAVHEKKITHIESFEMTGQELMDRMVQIRHGLTKRDINKALRSPMYLKYSMCMDDKIFISAPDNSDFDRMISRVRKQHRKVGFDLLCIDHLGLMTREGHYQRHDLMVGSMTRALKMLAKELEIPIILLSQLNRSSVKEGRIPQLADLRDSGNIEQDANHVIFLWSPTLVDANARRPPELEDFQMFIAKCRNGIVRNYRMTYVLINQRMRWEGMPVIDFRLEAPTQLIDMAGEQAALTDMEDAL